MSPRKKLEIFSNSISTAVELSLEHHKRRILRWANSMNRLWFQKIWSRKKNQRMEACYGRLRQKARYRFRLPQSKTWNVSFIITATTTVAGTMTMIAHRKDLWPGRKKPLPTAASYLPLGEHTTVKFGTLNCPRVFAVSRHMPFSAYPTWKLFGFQRM